MKRSKSRSNPKRVLVTVGVLFAMLMFFCITFTMVSAIFIRNITNNASTYVETYGESSAPAAITWEPDSAELTVAASPVMAPVLQALAGQFNEQGLATPDGQPMSVQVVAYEPQRMVDAALDRPGFQAISPDSSLWLDQLAQAWAEQTSGQAGEESAIPVGQQRMGPQVRYAVSPIVIAAWESAARELGWPDQPVGWQDIQQLATQDPDFKWNHPSTSTAAGLLATLAEFYAGAGLTRNLTEEAATAPETLEYVKDVESTIQFYGEGEEVIVQRLAQEGRDFLDAFVAQERVVIDWNRTQADQQGQERLVAIYPKEGALWTDHPLALLELGSRADELATTDNQRLTFQAFADYLTSAEVQQQLLASGYRPADLSIPLDAPGSPFADTGANAGAVDWRQPQATLQMPGPAVVDVVKNVWRLTKRPTNVYLVVDASGSMEGRKIIRTRQALTAFVNQIQGDRDQVGLIEFGEGLKAFTPLRVMDEGNRTDLLAQIDAMDASGGTALIDAVYAAVADLQAQSDGEAIDAVVVMTDGKENASAYGLRDLQALLQSGSGRPPVIFTIAFGADADEILLRNIAELGGGQFRRADATDIEELYRIISTYF
jgi:Ca-activated chloride channel family protein